MRRASGTDDHAVRESAQSVILLGSTPPSAVRTHGHSASGQFNVVVVTCAQH
ncbi:hypothetical protein AAGU66_12655 [Edwardsiella ictaluri]|uniref:hypothetical protein n=1 Tax=Edwardsiella ictaluri TaxID=67780 RepID=UPI00130D95CD|nr:hypothetical protein [Edwardsiella ictaluri]QPW30812.1 hypothetical protein F8539_13305 [Edwardsiella ictaluri]WFO09178.1 hypothetical protein MAY76_12935 [Edwardsiella ictaluri]WFO12099.1 hypothetical protein MAY82_12995 [Edwardsiella ictaluri]